MGDKDTANGFLALFSKVMNLHDLSLHDVIERHLTHKERDQVRAFYHRPPT